MSQPGRRESAAQRLAGQGADAEALPPFFDVGDPLADAAVRALSRMRPGSSRRIVTRSIADGIDAVPDAPFAVRRLFAQLDAVPDWVQPDRLHLGAETLLRTGPVGGLALLGTSLPRTYLSPAANKPLVLSGRLSQKAFRRMFETAAYVLAVATPDGLRRDGQGFAISVKVRLMHAQMRRLLAASPAWRPEAWGLPINQVDLAFTNLLFCVAFLEACRSSGLRFTTEEAEAVVHLWRYAGRLSGVDEALLPADEASGRTLMARIAALELPPDDDARLLVEAMVAAMLKMLSTAPRWVGSFTRAQVERHVRAHLGDDIANELGLDSGRPWAIQAPALAWSLGQRALCAAPRGRPLAVRLGQQALEGFLAMGLRGRPSYSLPGGLPPPPASRTRR